MLKDLRLNINPRIWHKRVCPVHISIFYENTHTILEWACLFSNMWYYNWFNSDNVINIHFDVSDHSVCRSCPSSVVGRHRYRPCCRRCRRNSCCHRKDHQIATNDSCKNCSGGNLALTLFNICWFLVRWDYQASTVKTVLYWQLLYYRLRVIRLGWDWQSSTVTVCIIVRVFL